MSNKTILISNTRMNNYKTHVKKQIVLMLMALIIILAVACRDGPPNEVFSPSDVVNRNIGALNGSPSALVASDLGVAITFFDIPDMLNHLRIGAVDCVIIERLVADEVMSNASGVRILGDPLLEYDLRFAVAKENKQLLDAVNEAIEELVFNGVLSGIREKYFAGRNYRYTAPTDIEIRPGELLFAVSPDNAPFSYRDDDGDFTGLDVEVARAVSDFLGVEYRFVEHDVSELISSVWYGKTDLSLGWLPDDVDDFVNVSEPYASSAHVVIVRR